MEVRRRAVEAVRRRERGDRRGAWREYGACHAPCQRRRHDNGPAAILVPAPEPCSPLVRRPGRRPPLRLCPGRSPPRRSRAARRSSAASRRSCAGWAPAWFALGEARERAWDGTPAPVDAYRSAALDPADRARRRRCALAALGATPAGPAMCARLCAHPVRPVCAALRAGPDRISPIAAPDFAATPRCTAQHRDAAVRATRSISAAAPASRVTRCEDVDALDGVDLSPPMIAHARRKGCYDRLEDGDIARFSRRRAGADLLIAADVLVYLGDLAPVCAASRACSRRRAVRLHRRGPGGRP